MARHDVAIIGMGTVGRELVRILDETWSAVRERHGVEFQVVAIYELGGALYDGGNPLPAREILHATDFKELDCWQAGITAVDHLAESGSEIVVDVTPTNVETGEPALSHITTGLKAGKDVVSSNKGPFYLDYPRITQLARQHGCLVGFESTVGSAIPILSAKETLAGNEITEITAILNGTSNFILSRMSSENIAFSTALKEAQERGYAEADPTLDIDGYDAAGKLVILVNVLMGWSKTIKDVQVRGIRNITPQAIALAREEGFVIKHLAIARENTLEVGPRMIPARSPIAIDGTLNAVKVTTALAGDFFFIGRGAGGSEAAAGLLSDMIWIAKSRDLENRGTGR